MKVDTTYYERCAEEYGNPCEKFCPANVYVVEREETTGKFQKLRIDFSNRVHWSPSSRLPPCAPGRDQEGQVAGDWVN